MLTVAASVALLLTACDSSKTNLPVPSSAVRSAIVRQQGRPNAELAKVLCATEPALLAVEFHWSEEHRVFNDTGTGMIGSGEFEDKVSSILCEQVAAPND